MGKKIISCRDTFLTLQTKQALFYALQESNKNGSDCLTLKFVFYGLLKTNGSLVKQIIKNIYKKNGKNSKDIKTLLYRCEQSFKKDKKLNNIVNPSPFIILSKPLRTLFYACVRDKKTSNFSKNTLKAYKIITTNSLLNSILKNEPLKNWLINEIFIFKNNK